MRLRKRNPSSAFKTALQPISGSQRALRMRWLLALTNGHGLAYLHKSIVGFVIGLGTTIFILKSFRRGLRYCSCSNCIQCRALIKLRVFTMYARRLKKYLKSFKRLIRLALSLQPCLVIGLEMLTAPVGASNTLALRYLRSRYKFRHPQRHILLQWDSNIQSQAAYLFWAELTEDVKYASETIRSFQRVNRKCSFVRGNVCKCNVKFIPFLRLLHRGPQNTWID